MDPGKVPENLDLENGNLAHNWESWKTAFDWYLKGQGKFDASDTVKIGQFMNTAGPVAQETFKTFELTETQKEKYDDVVEAFKKYCNPRKRIMFERHIFTNSKQEGDEERGETIDQYLTGTKLLRRVKSCEYTNPDEMVRDQFVFGLRDSGPGGIMKRLFREENVTLQKAVDFARASEASKQQMKALRDREKKSQSSEVNAVKKKSSSYKKGYHRRSHGASESEKPYMCKKCATTHLPRSCPAYGQKCRSCGEMNHYEKCCRKKPSKKHGKKHRKVHEVEEESYSSSEESDCFYIGVLSLETGDGDWSETLSTKKGNFAVKLDTGAQCNVVSEKIYRKVCGEPLDQSHTKLITFSKDRIKPLGQKTMHVKCKGKKYEVLFQVVQGNLPPILGRKDCARMELISRIDEVSTDVMEEYPDVFEGLGKIPGKYHITVDESVAPVVHAPRRVPHALKEKLKRELKSMEKKGIIRKVRDNEPTDWVNSLVVVPKPAEDQVRVCIDPKDLNRAIKREHYPMISHEEISAKLAGATHLTVLDAEKAFYQVDLDEASQKLLTFNTPFGRYCYLRMPMGITSASEVYQRRMNECLEDIDGVEVMMDDILVWGKSEREHDEHLRAALDRIRKNNIKLNKKKSQVKKQKVKFLGHEYSSEGVKIDVAKVEAVKKMPSPVD